MDDVLALIPKYYKTYHLLYPNVTIEEAEAFVKANWK